MCLRARALAAARPGDGRGGLGGRVAVLTGAARRAAANVPSSPIETFCFPNSPLVASKRRWAGRVPQFRDACRVVCYWGVGRGGDPSFGRLLPGELLRGYSVWGLLWGHKSATQLFVGIGTSPHPYNGLILVPRPLKTLRWRGSPFLDAACAPCLPSCGGCGGAPAQAPHRLHEGAPTWHLMRAAHRTRTLNSAFFLKRQIVIRGR